MLTFLEQQSPILLAFFATLFTYSITILGAAIVFFFKKVKKNIMDAMLGIAAGIMIAASFFSLIEPALKMAESLKMIPWIIVTIGFISGSIAYNKNKSYLYISNIDYCGGTDDNLYKKIECILYEEHGMVKEQIGSYTYEKDSSIKLNDFLKDVNFSIDNFAKECKNIESSNITLEISATDEEDKTTIYKVPLSMNKSCN